MRTYLVIWHGLDQVNHTYMVDACDACDAVAQTLRAYPGAMTAWVSY